MPTQVITPITVTTGQQPSAADWNAWLNAAISYINGGIDPSQLKVGGDGRPVMDIHGDALTVGGLTPAQIQGGQQPGALKTLADLIFGTAHGVVMNGGAATKDGTQANKLNVTACTVLQRVTSTGYLDRVDLAATSLTTSLASTTYYLYVQPAATAFGWSTAAPTGDYVMLAQVSTDGSGNISTVTDKRPLASNFFSGYDLAANAKRLVDAAGNLIADLTLTNPAWTLGGPLTPSGGIQGKSGLLIDYSTTPPTLKGAQLQGDGTLIPGLHAQQADAAGNYQVFTSSGTFTVPQGVYRIFVEMWGGGGGGGGGAGGGGGYNSSGSVTTAYPGGVGGGGGAGGYVFQELPVTPGQQITVTIGAGGTGGAGGAAGTATASSATLGASGNAGGAGGDTYINIGAAVAHGGTGGQGGADAWSSQGYPPGSGSPGSGGSYYGVGLNGPSASGTTGATPYNSTQPGGGAPGSSGTLSSSPVAGGTGSTGGPGAGGGGGGGGGSYWPPATNTYGNGAPGGKGGNGGNGMVRFAW